MATGTVKWFNADKVEFEVTQGPKGPNAADIRKI